VQSDIHSYSKLADVYGSHPSVESQGVAEWQNLKVNAYQEYKLALESGLIDKSGELIELAE
jgi:hypothetical protein